MTTSLRSAAALLLALVSNAYGAIIPATVTGKAIDNPFDGTVDSSVTVTNTTIDLRLNADDTDLDPSLIEDRGMIEFDLAALPPGNLSSALLQFELFGESAIGHPVNIYAYAGDGLISNADFTETSLLVTIVTFNNSLPSIDVTAALQTLILGGASHAGFLIRLTQEDAGLSFWANGSPQVLTPQLDVTTTAAVPEPGSVLLLGSGLALMVWRMRRKGKQPGMAG